MGKPRKAVKAKRKVGRPTLYAPELAEKICEQLTTLSMRKICGKRGMPHRTTVDRWRTENPDFAAKCAYATEARGDYMTDLVFDTASHSRPETAAADRVKVSAYQWLAEKLKPKAYGNRLDLTHANPDGTSLIAPIVQVYFDASNAAAELPASLPPAIPGG